MTLHVLFSPKAEGCPRLALDLIAQEHDQTGQRASVAFLRSEPTDLLREFEVRCGKVHLLGWRAKGFFGLGWRAWKLLRWERPRGVICYTLGQHVPIAVAAKLLGIPVVVHVGCRPPLMDRLAMLKMRLVMMTGSPLVKMHVACSEIVSEDCRNHYGLSNVKAVPNGIELERWRCLRDQRAAVKARSNVTDEIKFGMVGSLELSKDHTVLIRALRVLRDRGISAELHLIGDGSCRKALVDLAQECGVRQAIVWHGTVSDVGYALRELDVFSYAAKQEEGLGIALVEAMAAGVPVVASDVPACREVLEDGRWGRLVSTRDAAAWADALMQWDAIPIPPVEALSRYDIRATWRAYADAIGYQ